MRAIAHKCFPKATLPTAAMNDGSCCSPLLEVRQDTAFSLVTQQPPQVVEGFHPVQVGRGGGGGGRMLLAFIRTGRGDTPVFVEEAGQLPGHLDLVGVPHWHNWSDRLQEEQRSSIVHTLLQAILQPVTAM